MTTYDNEKVESLGGNQYRVTYTVNGVEHTANIDMDGSTIVSDDDYRRMEEAGIDIDDYIFAPMHGEGDVAYEIAANYCINYSGFNVDEYIAERQ